MENRNHKFRRKKFLTVDRLLIRLATAAVVLLLVVQTLLLSADARKYLSLVDKLEGEQITSPATMYAADVPWPNPNKEMSAVNKVVTKSIRTLRPSQNVTIRMINPPASDDAVVTVNGETGGHFGKGKVDLTIYDGDYIEIDAVNVKIPAQFIIDTHHGDMIYPVDGIMLESKNNMIVVGKVVFKR
ncbi:hypothetical protein [Sporomusa sp.]|uniref:hypothetical protein n=1 Tax=Sporomusa sp. TaxID=2078658 RepID=UPI002CBA4031|nr:hypothetical protein [Sporomusa sp.]HWR45263.1 hypothetical protein [Sporomusa sp.]